MPVTFSSIRQAQEFVRRYLPVSRLVPAVSLSQKTGGHVFLKLESELPTGSFKPRGALYALGQHKARWEIREVVASSTGNHGAAVAYAAGLLGVPAKIFLPENPNPVKRRRILQLGGKLEEVGRDLAAATEHASEYGKSEGVFFLNDATLMDVPAGTGTIGCEIVEQLPVVDTIYVPMGDTALIRGVATAAKHLSPRVKIIGVQAKTAPSYYLSWKKGMAVKTETCDTIADGMATRTPNAANVNDLRELVDDIRLVSDDEMLAAIWHLISEEHVVAEAAGAAATAALLQRDAPASRNTVLLVTGANVPPDILRRASNIAL